MCEIRNTSCCGVMDIDDLKGSDIKDIRHALEDVRKETGIVFATTLAKGYTNEIKALKSLGFEPVSTFKNPNSGNTVTMWVLEVAKLKPIYFCEGYRNGADCTTEISKAVYNSSILCKECRAEDLSY